MTEQLDPQSFLFHVAPVVIYSVCSRQIAASKQPQVQHTSAVIGGKVTSPTPLVLEMIGEDVLGHVTHTGSLLSLYFSTVFSTLFFFIRP